ncbi:hypothetical protein CPB84DRAFT_1748232 [Gymnopilus junonius]|uniref:Uncharacterized protein n=1 Tax=Gymnopilus junonius TaxID=109634 RepID=A0A9P5NMH0_GYMJU|nr:hypothetical protein CPB84DRAFT_1748232 [Gymnopilus junonius]
MLGMPCPTIEEPSSEVIESSQLEEIELAIPSTPLKTVRSRYAETWVATGMTPETFHQPTATVPNIPKCDDLGDPSSSMSISPNDDDNEALGGISDNKGELENEQALLKMSRLLLLTRCIIYHTCLSLTVVQPMKSVPEFIPPETISSAEIKKKQDIHINHLPVDVRQSFQEDLTLRLIEMYGIEWPWSVNLPDSRIIDLFKQVFPRHGAFSDSTQGKKIILKKPWCHWALNGDFKSRPFYYKEYLDPGAEGNEGNEKPLKLYHCLHAWISPRLPSSYSCSSEISPTASGALITAIQSAYCVIARWSSGTYITPGRPFSDFSGDNWGDSDKHNPSDFPATLPKYTVQGKKLTRELARHAKAVPAAGKKRARLSSGDNTTSEAAIVKPEEESDFEIEDDAADATGSTNKG